MKSEVEGSDHYALSVEPWAQGGKSFFFFSIKLNPALSWIYLVSFADKVP